MPSNLNEQEVNCFNEIVKPQLEELYSYDYDKSSFKNINIFVSKNEFPEGIRKPNIGEIKQILTKIPEKDLAFVTEIYFVSYHCKDDNHKVLFRETKGRTLPIIYKIIIYPKAYNRLKIILTHEIGHIIFEKEFNNKLKLLFASEMIKSFVQILFWTQEKRDEFIKEEFANSYEIFVNNPKRLKEFPFIYDFFKKCYTQSLSEEPTPISSSKEQ